AGPSGAANRTSEDDDGEGYIAQDAIVASSEAATQLPSINVGDRSLDIPDDSAETPALPRKSSKRRSQVMSPTEAKSLLLDVERPTTARLPFSGTISETSSGGPSHSRSASMNSSTYDPGRRESNASQVLSDLTASDLTERALKRSS